MKANTVKKFFVGASVALVLFVVADNARAALHIPNLGANNTQQDLAFAERFKLYGEPNFEPNANCDQHTALDLDLAQLNGKIAIVENRVSGICEIYAVPNTRIYRLERENAGCGSSLYKGRFVTERGERTIEILDHRNRTCRDLVPARVVVTETQDGETTVLYSGDKLPAQFIRR